MPTVTLPFEVETQAPYLNIRISNSHDDYESRLTSALLDTGATASLLISKKVAREKVESDTEKPMEYNPID